MSKIIQIRLANSADAGALAVLNQEFNESTLTSEEIESHLQKGLHPEIVLIVEVDNRVVGFACVIMMSSICYPHPWAELIELYIQPQFRRQGLGRALVEESERMARERSATGMHLLTGVANTAGQALYSALGYTKQPDLSFQKWLKHEGDG